LPPAGSFDGQARRRARMQLEAVFTTEVSRDLLDEDANSSDEIRASFTLTDLSNGVSTRRRSGQAVLA
jgi:hypothetical protein